MVYGAQQRNMIVDARPTLNALAMQTIGAGSEDMSNYKFATKAYLGIDNIHVMRDSLQKVIDALKDSDLTPLGPNRDSLQKSNWLKHIGLILDGVGLIARQVGLQHSHVLIHCSDGWDRTSQLSSLSQICLDPYYRTIEGFIILVEKDWLSFGHMFKHRSGFLSSEKWFQVEGERISRANEDVEGKDQASTAISGAQKTFENAFLSAKGFFSNARHNDSRESLNVDSEADAAGNESESQPARRIISGSSKKEKDKVLTKVKETSPVFHQFLDATYQLMYQHPTRFEFTERFLRRLLYHLYSCQYGTFLLDNEKDRREAGLNTKTRSVWDYFLSRKKEFANPKYDSVVDDNVRGKERLIFPRSEELRWWNELFGRTDDEMNGKLVKPSPANGGSDVETDVWTSVGSQSASASMPVSRARTPVLVGVETSEASIGLTSSPKVHEPISRTRTPVSSAGAPSSQLKESLAEKDLPNIPYPDPVPEKDGHLSPELEAEAGMDGLKISQSVPVLSSSAKELKLENADAVPPSTSVARETVLENKAGGQHQPYSEQPAIEPTTENEDAAIALLRQPGIPPQGTSSTTEGVDPVQPPPPQEQSSPAKDSDVSAEAPADDLDPLGIGDVKDHVPQSKRAHNAQERRREQMDLLLK